VLLELCNRGPDEVVKYLKGKGADFNRKIYLLIDEIQYLENLSSFLKLFHNRYRSSVKLLVTGQMLETSVYSLFRKNTDVENITFWRTNKGQGIDFVLNFPKKNKVVPVEVKLNYTAKHQRNLRYFMEKYPAPNGYLCCLDKSRAGLEDRITVSFPWQTHSLF